MRVQNVVLLRVQTINKTYMKKSLLALAVSMCALSMTAAETPKTTQTPPVPQTFTIDGKDYSYNLLTSKQVGPGVVYNRIRIADFPLNINYMTVDLTNPYNRIETQQANERVGSTEKLVDAYARMQKAGKKPIGAQNGNFWCVSGAGLNSQFALGTLMNGGMRNGQIVNETNCHNDIWNEDPSRTGVVGLGYDKDLHIESMSWKGYISSPRFSADQKPEFYLVNKFCRSNGEMALYNSFYGTAKKFQTIEYVNGAWTTVDNKTCEVYLKLKDGQKWTSNGDIVATVGEIRTNTTAGTLGDYDICIAGSGSYKTILEQLQVGDEVTVNYAWYSTATNQPYTLEQVIGGNSMVMVGGEQTVRNQDDSYNSKVYSRSAYGKSQDGKTLYMFTIDMSTDPVYGRSAGCTTSVMCQILKQLGAWDVCNVDAGGSAQLMVQGAVVNKTTEGTPRAVANGWMVYSTAPDEDAATIASIAFLDPTIRVPIYSSCKPIVLGYNKYGELINENVEGVTFAIAPEYGEVTDEGINILGKEGETTLTATYNGIKVEKAINVISAEVGARVPQLLNDGREYPIEVVSKVGFDSFVTYPAVNVTTDEMAKNTVSTFELPLESVIDINDVSNYPLTVNAIRMDLGKSDKGKAYELLIPEFKAVYNTYGSVETLNAESSSMRLYPNPVADGMLNIAAEGVGTLSVYNNAGALVLSQPLDCSAGVAAANVASLQAGIYYARFVTANGASVQKFIVK